MKGMLRPAQTVMPASAVEPEAAVVSPPPNRFTHAVRVTQPFYLGSVLRGEPGGALPTGAKVGTDGSRQRRRVPRDRSPRPLRDHVVQRAAAALVSGDGAVM